MDMYSTSSSVKALEMKRRGIGEKLIVEGTCTRKPKDWKNFLCNDENKKQFVKLIYNVWRGDTITHKLKRREVLLIKEDEAFNIAHQYADEQPITELASNQQETVSRIVLYCMYGADNGYDCVKSPDIDIFWILLHHVATINYQILLRLDMAAKDT